MNQPRHGSPADRGSADRYYGRPCKPHYFKGATYQSEEVTEQDMTPQEIAEYTEAWENETDRKHIGNFDGEEVWMP